MAGIHWCQKKLLSVGARETNDHLKYLNKALLICQSNHIDFSTVRKHFTIQIKNAIILPEDLSYLGRSMELCRRTDRGFGLRQVKEVGTINQH